ncbi:MAG: GAF domain-containing sensor histidine kinase [Candidatus Omnitrophota bacterium]
MKDKLQESISAVADNFEIKTMVDDMHRQNRDILERRLFELAAAYHIGKEASSVFDFEKCLRILANRIADLLSVEIVSLMLLDTDKGGLVIKFAKGLNDEIIREAKIKLGEGVAGWIAMTGEPLLIKDLDRDSRFSKRSNGRYYTNSLLSVPLKVRDRVIGVINVNNKITKEVFREEDLDILKTIADFAAVIIENARLQEEARSRDQLKSDFVSNVSHELRTPLTAIKEAVGLLLEGMTGQITQEQKRFLEVAKQNIERLGRLIDELLELAKLDAKKAPAKRKLFDVAGMVKTVASSLSPLAREKGLLFTSILPGVPIEIWGDPDKLTQVVTNLVDNAIKYNRPKGKVEVGVEEKGEMVEITVIDTGMGIPREDFEKIFDRFHRMAMHARGEVPGTGLGLSIVKGIVDVHGGQVRLDSEIGKGSKFSVILPRDIRKSER